MDMLSEVQRIAAAIPRSDKQLFFSLRLLFLDDAGADFEPHGFTTRHALSFRVRGAGAGLGCGHVFTSFAGFRIKAETNVTLLCE